MDSLNGIQSFVKTAELLSFVKAARALGISASAVGKNVARLEGSLKVRLFQRSTRKVNLTAEGELFYQRCRRILDDLQDAEAMLCHAAQAPRGRLRVSLPTIGYRFLLPLMPAFRNAYPEVELEMDFNDNLVDVIEEGFDVVIRSGGLADSGLMARKLGAFRFVLCAAPGYLARKGRPLALPDLESHECLRYRFVTTGKLMDWSLSANPEITQLRLPTVLTLNNMEAVRMAAVDGHGIAYMPDFLVREALETGALETVLDAHMQDRGQFWALWPSSRHLSPKIRVFVDFIAERLFK
ncbi:MULTISPECIES: LysR substrate-binding domain-containing protein [unclassified Pseudomonas]|uniref:LysR substrate-binding domain-containing protein n=1 Tax=unclassified Pseudomonas TaxID=196821 RepID=UPI000BCF5408|nr:MULTISPECIES: LysR substrate-binding domain-containing protein [unclassified Pseudomonas]PVZ10524.1 DNA-binding transcriptional LysR family regulator [Pseudomonas sp. URIL14HWK12:I12]PVZ21950.1 DNA-binding transcriptional LysR family regulator [Pseudomonas sp. URIL14HWK12:I10]PVZ30967.1 DNA-binding transcriptional LysR family regulator [Pseudomonas sp. URIL14HWK12:I11]SNZ17433.1 DNA-binding transcriptional regulator, LysR family [Pseudomonas sp. URIL14HWK12:I9]